MTGTRDHGAHMPIGRKFLVRSVQRRQRFRLVSPFESGRFGDRFPGRPENLVCNRFLNGKCQVGDDSRDRGDHLKVIHTGLDQLGGPVVEVGSLRTAATRAVPIATRIVKLGGFATITAPVPAAAHGAGPAKRDLCQHALNLHRRRTATVLAHKNGGANPQELLDG